MKLFVLKYLILLGSIELAFSQAFSSCPLYTWQCNNGQCIKSEELCDGNYDCDDRSDETVEECLLRPCPSFAFQCTYGACITGKLKCNGVLNCADKSDENRYLCRPNLNYEQEMQGNCSRPNSMQCETGECINNDRLCDGKIDCMDGSDETVEVCSFLKCPDYSFRCGYGACITGTHACNGVKDCWDGSDEIPSICLNIYSTTPTQPTATTIKPSSGDCIPGISDCIDAHDCENGYDSVLNICLNVTSETKTSTVKPSSEVTTSITPSILEKHCSAITLMRGISSVATCVYQNRPISCNQDVKVGTIANVSCATGYSPKPGRRNIATTKCDTDGEWTRPKIKCVPECGTLTEEQKTRASKPWEVTILRRDYAPIFMPICSGVIVSSKIVLTAARCFLSYNDAYYTDHIFYNLIEGFYNQSFINGDQNYAKVHNISDISIKINSRTQDLAVLTLVNYFQFGRDLIPICLPTAQSNLFPFFDNTQLNIGRPIARDTTKIYLEYIIASIENKGDNHKTLNYVNIYHYIPFINREIKKYDYLL